ncbi:MAG: hypothetical protein PHX04_04420 [Bacilli bacterium]|nr:hypothetical protein [Bacilli bacterium]
MNKKNQSMDNELSSASVNMLLNSRGYKNFKTVIMNLINGKLFRFYDIIIIDEKATMLLESLSDEKIYYLSFIEDSLAILPMDIENKTILDDFGSIILVHNYKGTSFDFECLIKTDEGLLFTGIDPFMHISDKNKISLLYPKISFYINKRVEQFTNANKPIKEFISKIRGKSHIRILLQKDCSTPDFELNLGYKKFRTKNYYKIFENAYNDLLTQAKLKIAGGSVDFSKDVEFDKYANVSGRYPEEYEAEEDKNIERDNFKYLSLERLKTICPATMTRLNYECSRMPAAGSVGDIVSKMIILDEEKTLYLYKKLGMYSWYYYFHKTIEALVKEGKYYSIMKIFDILIKRANCQPFPRIKEETEFWVRAVCDCIPKIDIFNDCNGQEINKISFLYQIIDKLQNSNIEDEFIKDFIAKQTIIFKNYINGIVVKKYEIKDFNDEIKVEDQNVEPLNNMPIINYSDKDFKNKFTIENKYAGGSEGIVFKISDDKLVKISKVFVPEFNPFGGSLEQQNEILYGEPSEKTLKRKRKKTELLYESAQGLPGNIPRELITRDGEVVGYSFDFFLKEKAEGDFETIRKSGILLGDRIALLQRAEANIRQFHDREIGLGDLNETNILGNTPKIIDIDNASIGGLRADLFPLYMRYYRNVIKTCNMSESDMFSFGITALSMLTDMPVHYMMRDECSNLDTLSMIVDLIPDEYKDIRDYFRILLNPTAKNEYITPALKSLTLKPKEKVIRIDQKYF